MPTIRRLGSGDTELWGAEGRSEWHVAVVVYSADAFEEDHQDVAEHTLSAWNGSGIDVSLAAGSDDPMSLADIYRILGQLEGGMQPRWGTQDPGPAIGLEVQPEPDGEAPVRVGWQWSWDEPPEQQAEQVPTLDPAQPELHLTEGWTDEDILRHVLNGRRLGTVALRNRWRVLERERLERERAQIQMEQEALHYRLSRSVPGTSNPTLTNYTPSTANFNTVRGE